MEELKVGNFLIFNPGDYGGNAHRGTRWHSMQSFGGPFYS